MRLLQCLFLALLCWSQTVSASDIILKPLEGKNGPEKLMVYIIGAKVAPAHYQAYCEELQRQSPFKLWVVIPAFLGNFPDPLTISRDIKGVIKQVKAEGFSTVSQTDVIVAAHSLGGIFAQSVAKNDGYSALILYGSYLVKKAGHNVLAEYPIPVMQVEAELDGLTRASRVAYEYKNYKTIAEELGENYAMKKGPVVMLDDINHSSFCADYNVTDDIIPAEINTAAGHARIANLTVTWLSVVFQPSDESKAAMKAYMQHTDEFFAPYLQLQTLDAEKVCESAQYTIAGLSTNDAARLTVFANYTDDEGVFQSKSAALFPLQGSGSNAATVSVVSHPWIEPNKNDRSLTPQAPIYVQCQLKSKEAVAQSLGIVPSKSDMSCVDANMANYEVAVKTLSLKTVKRYQRRGKQLKFFPDAKLSSEKDWFDFKVVPTAVDAAATTWQVVSPAFVTPVTAAPPASGLHMCSVVPPSRVAEWIMTDGLKDKPSV